MDFNLFFHDCGLPDLEQLSIWSQKSALRQGGHGSRTVQCMASPQGWIPHLQDGNAGKDTEVRVF